MNDKQVDSEVYRKRINVVQKFPEILPKSEKEELACRKKWVLECGKIDDQARLNILHCEKTEKT